MSGEVQVLTDTYGRVLTQYTEDGDFRTACVYVPGDSRIDWDDASDQELVTLLGKYGYNDALTIENNNVTINDNGETETLTWDSAAMDFTVDIDMFQNGAQNLFFRTVNDGILDVTVLCDADGKAIVAPTLGEYTGVLFSVANNGTKIDTITSDSSISAADVIQACGGSVNVTALDAGASVFLLVMGTHVQFCNADDTTTTPNVTEFPVPPAANPLYYKIVNLPAGGPDFPNKVVGLANDTLLMVDDQSWQDSYVVITDVSETYWQASANTEYVETCQSAFTNVIHVNGTWLDDGVTFVVEGKECTVSYEGTITPEPQPIG